jgi:hypothetical protein
MRKTVAPREPWLQADWPGLAATPAFAIMALLTEVIGGGPQDILCAAAQDASPLGGMVPMYLLMSAFHLAPWLKLISRQRGGGRRFPARLFRERNFTLESWPPGKNHR